MSQTNTLKTYRHVKISGTSANRRIPRKLTLKDQSFSTTVPTHQRAHIIRNQPTKGTCSYRLRFFSGKTVINMTSTTTVPNHLNFITGNKNKLAEVCSTPHFLQVQTRLMQRYRSKLFSKA